jgi:hypothetical protein
VTDDLVATAIEAAGHKKTGAPDLPSAIGDSKRYLEDCFRAPQPTKNCSTR